MNPEAFPERLSRRHLVLLGIGHTNAHVVRQWGMNPISDTDLTCISDFDTATYSGMLPAVLAGQLPPDAMEIDLVRLCASVNARLIVGSVTGVDLDRREVQIAGRPSVPFDALSIGIGSVPTMEGVDVSETCLLRIKPMQTFRNRLSTALQQMNHRIESDRPFHIVVVGSGVAGIEIAFCLPSFVGQHTDRSFTAHVVTRSNQILDGTGDGYRRRALAELKHRSVTVTTSATVTAVSHSHVTLEGGTQIDADLVIWATGASPPELFSQLDLPQDAGGFLLTSSTLQALGHPMIFAVGDSGTIRDQPLPKAGVYAVRQGSILWHNLQAVLQDQPSVRAYHPQRSFLKLLNLGDGRAIGEWKGLSFSGAWVMKLKQHIDQRFMRMYRVTDAPAADFETMPCRGCACKLGSAVLQSVLTAPPDDGGSAFASEYSQLDDAALVDVQGQQVVASTDFFTSPFRDIWLTGRIAAIHALGDLTAMGSIPVAAIANVVVPEDDASSQQKSLSDLMAGARLEFERLNVSIVGGHTIVGPRWEVGFTVIGESPAQLLRKSGLQTGDRLYLTKPLGTGILLAAHMKSQCPALAYRQLVESMLHQQHQLVVVAQQLQLSAVTDVTGFGLVGHLLEMLQASRKSAKLDLHQVPVLPGVESLIERGYESTFVPENLRFESSVQASSPVRAAVRYRTLFDPQTCGGFLLAVPAQQAVTFEQEMSDQGFGTLACVGEIHDCLIEPVVEIS